MIYLSYENNNEAKKVSLEYLGELYNLGNNLHDSHIYDCFVAFIYSPINMRLQSHANLNVSRMLFRVTYNVRVFAKAGNSLNVQPGTNAQLKIYC